MERVLELTMCGVCVYVACRRAFRARKRRVEQSNPGHGLAPPSILSFAGRRGTRPHPWQDRDSSLPELSVEVTTDKPTQTHLKMRVFPQQPQVGLNAARSSMHDETRRDETKDRCA